MERDGKREREREGDRVREIDGWIEEEKVSIIHKKVICYLLQ